MSDLALPQDLWAVEPASVAERWSKGLWQPVAHLNDLSRYLAGMWSKPLRVIVDMPPRHGKSELCSHWLPAWFLAVWPRKRVILASYEADFAATWGRKVRNTLQESGLGVISPESQAADHWETTQGGGMVTAGVGGPITGRGADLLIIDDPVKNSEEANSPTYREHMWEWWQTTARPRLEPGASIVVIMTRWHVDDLVGRLLADNSEPWEHRVLPAITDGKALWPERFGVQALIETRNAIGEAAWQSLYMQQPSSVGGRYYFDLESLRQREQDTEEPRSTELGGLLRVWRPPVVAAKYVAGGDVAWGESGAFSCLPILDWRTGAQVAELYGRPALDEMASETVKLCRRYNSAFVGVERNGEGETVARRMVELGYGPRMFWADNEKDEPKVPGWLTGPKNRPVMLAELEEAVRLGAIVPRCKDSVREMKAFVRDDRGRPVHSEGHYDDHVMALALAWQMRQKARWSSSQIVKLEYEAGGANAV